MTLQEIRKKFIDLSGRLDLVSGPSATSDNGADWFINAGQRYLDRQIDTGKSRAHYYDELASGTHLVKVKHSRAIERVFIAETDGSSRVEVLKADPWKVRRYYEKPFSEIEASKPSYYFPTYLRQHADSDTVNVAALLRDVIVTDDEDYNGIVLIPPTDKAYVVEVVGLFYSNKLSANDDVSYWSKIHPDLLVMSALARLEVFYRNATGVNDFLGQLNNDLAQIDMDAVAQQIVDIDQMEG